MTSELGVLCIQVEARAPREQNIDCLKITNIGQPAESSNSSRPKAPKVLSL